MKQPYCRPHELLGACRLVRVLRCREQAEIWRAARGSMPQGVIVKFFRRTHPRLAQIKAICEKVQTLPESRHVVQVLQSGNTPNGDFFVVLEWAGITLRHWLNHHKKLTPGQALGVWQQVLLALKVIHASGIIHRDLKPENIYLTDDGTVKVGDFGIAQIPEWPEKDRMVWGTAPYMAPEQLENSAQVDFRTDLFSLGLIIYEALVGERRYQNSKFLAVLREQQRNAVDCEAKLSAVAPRFMTGVLLESLELNPALRPNSAREVLTQIAQCPLEICPLK